MAIHSFADKATESFFITGRLKKRVGWDRVAKIARRKLDMIHYAAMLEDLNSPPGNRLEALKGKWLGYYSIRINDQWRVIFKWSDRGPEDVRIADYH